jgi:hypothetical protein
MYLYVGEKFSQVELFCAVKEVASHLLVEVPKLGKRSPDEPPLGPSSLSFPVLSSGGIRQMHNNKINSVFVDIPALSASLHLPALHRIGCSWSD